MLTYESIKQVLKTGVMLSSERDLNRLLDTILASVMTLANCDAGTLYLLDGDALRFKIMYTNSMGTHSGGDGKDPDLPPVPLRRENVCAFAFLEGRTVLVEDVYASEEYDFSGPLRYDSITGYHTRSMLVVPMRNREDEKLGVIQLINAMDKDGNIQPFPEDMILVLESMTSQAAVAIQNVRYMQEIKALFHSFVRVMSAAIDERSAYNANHSRRMAMYGEKFADFLNDRALQEEGKPVFSPRHKEELIMSIWLHDIGKLITPLEIMDKAQRLTPIQRENFRHRMSSIRLLGRIAVLDGHMSPEEGKALEQETKNTETEIDSVSGAGFLSDEKIEWLNQVRRRTYTDEDGETRPWITDDEYHMLSIRKGTLSGEERQIMEGHVVVTDRLLSQIRFSADLSHVREWAGAHHELLNGSGYPRHLQGDSIPMEVRIITILDIFDALVADDRPYKPGMPVDKALSILDVMAHKEGKLDPRLAKLFTESRCWEGVILTGEKREE